MYRGKANWKQDDHFAVANFASSTSSAVDFNSFNENRLQAVFHGNYISGGVFKININLHPQKIQ